MAGDRYISVPEGEITTLRSQLAEARAEIERLTKERDEAREYGKQARLRENAAEDARIHEQHRASVAEARAAALEAQNGTLREALEIIAGRRQCLDNLMGNRDVAEAALLTAAKEGAE